MVQTKEQKKAIVEKLENAFKSAASVVFVHFRGVSVADESAMRRELRSAGVSYTVAKKTLIRRTLDALGLPADDVKLEGEVALAYGGGDDSTLTARLVHRFGEKLGGKLAILGGIFEGKLVGQAYMQEIATIPPMETLRAMFAQLINSPRVRFAIVLSKVAEKKS
ncbi:50S ribosomal protein L10 [Candidatus Kaiserbacteria bacterium RIFCSPHIGHO2_01_FULL_50_13]|uniref:Large ribosomal subunit protein uL10 n=1 Tax=Candidatus Kaiserbacteria bacterium RIFCSPLOWO2_01_FULL_50_24 TaxID=1798507 RepID=A0A1F6ER07_9BACT|nr:MAG: 50S ribosomal protein L10 [Candidatus Kaiserbacteria bacterium RIFCSPHIGHO2_01_FULL_50_13]OGG76048.1 MAG: 50S ribosomal protein L10 [Candidatus Kaiserbacteria bacterium RIFCSPLOWO2_01_FULL_50_24]OGG81341.1 MAG: 50S ribosomal protein L10 [Candidatus Kaiserbacteria bacterium RIFCSPLOWO2_02_FULL_51_13]